MIVVQQNLPLTLLAARKQGLITKEEARTMWDMVMCLFGEQRWSKPKEEQEDQWVTANNAAGQSARLAEFTGVWTILWSN